MVIPRLMRQALDGQPLTVYGDGTQTRCFCDVQDVVEAIVGLTKHPNAPGQVFNVGSTDEISITSLAQRIQSVAGSNSPLEYVPYSKAYAPGFEDLQRRVPNTEWIRVLLSWSPRLSSNETCSASNKTWKTMPQQSRGSDRTNKLGTS